MAFRISAAPSLADDVRRIAREQVDAAIAESRDQAMPDVERVHGIRKRCKKLRGLLRLVRSSLGDAYRRENEHFRDLAHALAPLRDGHAVVAAYDAVVSHFRAEIEPGMFAALRRRLMRRRPPASDLTQRLTDVGHRLHDVRERIVVWPLDDTAGPEIWRRGFEQTYGQARRALAAAYDAPSATSFHEWRKRVKYHSYHTRLLSPIWDEALAARSEAANTLGELLGVHHDLAVLRDAVLDIGLDGGADSVGSFVALLDRHQAHIETAARPIGLRLFADKASHIGARYEKYWAAWLEDPQGPASTLSPTARASA